VECVLAESGSVCRVRKPPRIVRNVRRADRKEGLPLRQQVAVENDVFLGIGRRP
jgi:hypothetical protein